MEFLVIEAEGLPDIAGGRQMYGLAPGLPDREVAKVMFHHHLHGGGGAPFLGPHLRAIAAVSLVRCRDERLQRTDLKSAPNGEREVLGELVRISSREHGSLLAWDGERNVSTWLNLRALIHGTSWNPPVVKRVESELDLADTRIDRHHLASRLAIAAVEMPDDQTGWEHFRQTGIAGAVGRCAVNAMATAHLWLRHCLARDVVTADEYEALSDQLSRMTLPPLTDAA